MGSAASSSLGMMPMDDAEALALLAERQRRPEIVARTVREHDIDIDMALHDIDAETLASLVSRKIDHAHLKKALRQLRAHFSHGKQTVLETMNDAEAVLEHHGEAARPQLRSSSPTAQTQHGSNIKRPTLYRKKPAMHGDVGIIRVIGNTAKITTTNHKDDQPLGELLLQALELVTRNKIDVVELDDGDYQMQDGKGGVWTVFGRPDEEDGFGSEARRQVVIKAMRQSDNGGRKGVTLRGCLRISMAFDDVQSDKSNINIVNLPTTALPEIGDPGYTKIQVLVQGISITNPGDNSGAHESLQHAVLVDGNVRASLTNCDIYGCIHKNGCGVCVRHSAFCEVGYRTIVRDCHTGIKVDSMAYVDCIGCDVYSHLLSGLLVTNVVRAEAYADQLEQNYEEKKDGSDIDSDGSSSSDDEDNAAPTTIQRLSQLQMTTRAPFSYIRGACDKKGRISRMTNISCNGDCSIFVSDGGRLRIDKGANIYGNKDRGLHVEDRNSLCEVHELVSIHHNKKGNIYWVGNDGSILRRYEKRRQSTDDGGSRVAIRSTSPLPPSENSDQREILYIEEPLQWWRKPDKLLNILPRALEGSTQHQLEIAYMYAGKGPYVDPRQNRSRNSGTSPRPAGTAKSPKRQLSSIDMDFDLYNLRVRTIKAGNLVCFTDGSQEMVVVDATKRPEEWLMSARGARWCPVWPDKSCAMRWAKMVEDGNKSEETAAGAKKLLKELKMML
eukprot:g726.t1